jgi:hypothetical protein
MTKLKVHAFHHIALARLYPFKMAQKYNNRSNLSIHKVFKPSSLDW